MTDADRAALTWLMAELESLAAAPADAWGISDDIRGAWLLAVIEGDHEGAEALGWMGAYPMPAVG